MVSPLLLLACAGGDEEPEETGGDEASVALPSTCGPLPPQPGVPVSPEDDVPALVAAAAPGTTFLLADGTYDFTHDQASLDVRAEGVTIRSASGDAAAVVLDGGDATADLVSTRAAGLRVAEITLRNGYASAVAAYGAGGLEVWGVRVEQISGAGVVARPFDGAYADGGVVACSTLVACGVAVDLVQAEGWSVRDNVLEACEAPAMQLRDGSKDTVVERNVVRGDVVVGGTEYEERVPRVYADAPCANETAGHYGGVVRNNLVDGELYLADACSPRIVHDTVLGGIGWTGLDGGVVRNNLAVVDDAGGATAVEGNLAPVSGELTDDLHLAPGAAAIDAGVPLEPGEADDDVDREPRDDGAPDVGADEVG